MIGVGQLMAGVLFGVTPIDPSVWPEHPAFSRLRPPLPVTCPHVRHAASIH
jgi:hypothetical protein